MLAIAYFILEDDKENAFEVNMDKSNPELANVKAFGEDAMVVIYFAQWNTFEAQSSTVTFLFKFPLQFLSRYTTGFPGIEKPACCCTPLITNYIPHTSQCKTPDLALPVTKELNNRPHAKRYYAPKF